MKCPFAPKTNDVRSLVNMHLLHEFGMHEVIQRNWPALKKYRLYATIVECFGDGNRGQTRTFSIKFYDLTTEFEHLLHCQGLAVRLLTTIIVLWVFIVLAILEPALRRHDGSMITRAGFLPLESRTSSIGSSSITVPMPTITASNSERSRWTFLRDSSQVIQPSSFEALLILLSCDVATLPMM